ncbi:G-protein coupled receptor dmsr-1-like [Ruditapes philippinarum]|uniref:G-protein coupled receptor dmsr-1-like n=1 Tax=Ruditapes philippinarum TaxID=129788 RepID=UPI00295B5036|nr:G-protein coupled receptor dmsr-1-like [Ruditapes philippinarum]
MNASDVSDLDIFSMRYSKWHGYISLLICALGIPLNILNIIVLTRSKMRTAINFILTCIAICDMTTMLSYVPFAVHFYCQYSANSILPEKNSLQWMNFLLVHLNVTATAHTISIWLAVALAIIRYHQIHSPAHGSITHMRRIIRARVITGTIVIFSIVILIPNYLCHKLKLHQSRDNSTLYVFEEWRLGSAQVDTIRVIALVMYSSLAKLLPCVMIIIYGGLLLRTLHKTIQHQQQLAATSCLNSKRSNNPSRTTTMLLIVFVLFIFTELPQGILILCCIFIKNFFERTYIPLGDVMDIFTLLNNSINFVLYCTMSQEFRRAFVEVFCSSSRNDDRNKYPASSAVYQNNIKTSYI